MTIAFPVARGWGHERHQLRSIARSRSRTDRLVAVLNGVGMMCDHGPGPTGTITLFVVAFLSVAVAGGVGWFLGAFEEAREFDRMEQRR